MRRMVGWMAALLLVVLGAVAPVALAAPGDWDNETDGHLNNGGFEAEFYNVGDEWIADHWTHTYLQGSGDWNSTCRFVNGGPNCDQGWVEKMAGVDSMILSVEDLHIGQPYEAVLYQTASGLVPGRSYSFSGWLLKMWGGSANPTPPSDPESFGSRVGVDPTGGTNPAAPTVQWSEYDWEWSRGQPHRWVNQRHAFTAQSGQATVFVRLWLRHQRAETQAIVDAMELFDAPTVVATAAPAGPAPALSWVGTLPAMFAARGPNFRLFYDVQRQQPDGSWATIVHWTESTSYAPTLAPGERATFRVVPFAFEPPGSPINWPPTIHTGLPSAPITLEIDSTPPTAQLILPGGRWHLADTALTVAWQGADVGSGVANYDVEARLVGGEWSRWLSGTTATSAPFPEAMSGGARWEFRARAWDGAGNVGGWSEVQTVNVYGALLSGRVLSATGTVTLAPQIEVMASPFAEAAVVGAQGEYRVYLPGPGNVTLTFRDHAGVQRLPATTVTVSGTSATRNWWLAPVPSAVTNGHFEEGGGWSGSWSPDAPASGTTSARLAAGSPIAQSVSVAAGGHLSLVWRPVTAGAQLRVSLGSQQWTLSGASSEWQPWSQPTGAGTTQTLTLTAVGGAVAVDQVAIGPPDAVPSFLYLPIMTR